MAAGRPKGATSRPQFHTYVTEIERKDFVKWIKTAYKKDKELARWYGDQMFGKATQTIAGDADNPLAITFKDEQIDAIFKRRNKGGDTRS